MIKVQQKKIVDPTRQPCACELICVEWIILFDQNFRKMKIISFEIIKSKKKTQNSNLLILMEYDFNWILARDNNHHNQRHNVKVQKCIYQCKYCDCVLFIFLLFTFPSSLSWSRNISSKKKIMGKCARNITIQYIPDPLFWLPHCQFSYSIFASDFVVSVFVVLYFHFSHCHHHFLVLNVSSFAIPLHAQ